MEGSLTDKRRKRQSRAIRIRKGIFGNAVRPRLTVTKSNKHIAAQIIDDEKGVTLVAVSSQIKSFKAQNLRRNKFSARVLGTEMGIRAKAKGLEALVFDRGFYKFHGVIAEFADAVRAAGLQF